MTDLLFWFLVSQTVTGLPEMAPGTEVRLVSMDLLTIYASAQVEEGQLSFTGDIKPDSEVRVLILRQNATPQETVEALGQKALFARVSPEGDDILLTFEELDGPLSFGKWLEEERDITLHMPSEGGTGE